MDAATHARITRLYVNNYRCFVGFEFRPAQRTLLVGDNGSGKSSLLDVLASIQQILVWDADATDAFPRETVAEFGGSNEQRFELDVASEWGSFQYKLLVKHDLDGETCAIEWEEVSLDGKLLYQYIDKHVELYGDDHTPGKTFSFTPKRSFLASLEPKQTNKRLNAFRTFVAGIWMLRLNPSNMAAVAPKAEDGGFFLDHDGRNFASWFRLLLQIAPERVQKAQTMLKELLSGFDHLSMVPAGRAKVLVANFRYPGGKPYNVDFDGLSDGQRALIVLYVILNAVAGEATVLCLDEPDNFVSIREIQPFLVALADRSDETGLQSIFISHSAEVIDYLASDAVLLDRPEGAQTRIQEMQRNGSLRLSELLARGWHVTP